MLDIVQNHPFIDGNKRVGLEAALLFLEINGLSVEATDEAIVNLVLQTAQGQATKEHIADFLRSHASGISDGIN